MDTETFVRIMRKDPQKLSEKFFGGAYCLKDVPLNISTGKWYLLNLAADSYGSHWLLLSLLNSKRLEILDSFAHPAKLFYQRLLDIAKNINATVYCFPRSIQSELTTSCALFSLMFSFLICRGYTGREILVSFFPPLPKHLRFRNDILVANFVKVIYSLDSVSRFIFDIEFLRERERLDAAEREKKSQKKKKIM